MKNFVTAAVFVLFVFFLPSGAVSAMENNATLSSKNQLAEPGGIGDTFMEGFSWRLNAITYGVAREPEIDSIVNAGNQQNITKYESQFALRPDLDLSIGSLLLSGKPRWTFTYEKWNEGGKADEHETTDDFFVNEWLAQLMVTDELFLSYGRENIQWGPASLISPSNPFIKDNGRDNPMLEVSGLDYGRIVWIPNYNWSASLIANTDEGEHEFYNEFQKTYSFKIDYTGYRKYASLILSHREDEGERLGLYFGWWVSDAVLIYGEGSGANESVENDSVDLDLLAGLSYTFEMGPIFSCEYFYNENGYTGPIHEALPPFGTANLDDVLIRKNYGFIQLVDNNIGDVFNYVLRWIQDFDDSSSRAIGIMEYEINDHFKAFTVGDLFIGDENDEFGSVNRYSLYLGVEMTY